MILTHFFIIYIKYYIYKSSTQWFVYFIIGVGVLYRSSSVYYPSTMRMHCPLRYLLQSPLFQFELLLLFWSLLCLSMGSFWTWIAFFFGQLNVQVYIPLDFVVVVYACCSCSRCCCSRRCRRFISHFTIQTRMAMKNNWVETPHQIPSHNIVSWLANASTVPLVVVVSAVSLLLADFVLRAYGCRYSY